MPLIRVMTNQAEILIRTIAGAAIIGLFTWTYTISNSITRIETIQDAVVEHTAQIDDNERAIIRMENNMHGIDRDLEDIKKTLARIEHTLKTKN